MESKYPAQKVSSAKSAPGSFLSFLAAALDIALSYIPRVHIRSGYLDLFSNAM